MTQNQRDRLEEGTQLARACIVLIWACLNAGIGFSCENPHTSMLWVFPEMKEVMEHATVIVVDLVYCSYGAPWKKPTRLITNVKAIAALASHCSGDHEHITLRGVAPCGTLWTRLACTYPAQLCRLTGRQWRRRCRRAA